MKVPKYVKVGDILELETGQKAIVLEIPKHRENIKIQVFKLGEIPFKKINSAGESEWVGLPIKS